jgi:predicted nucleotidyltransferase component of viral defense system
MDKWAKASSKDREALFNETAAKKGISPEIVEKDFWVCWALLQVSRLTDLPRLTFKGGTSLSKAFGIIKRFSEDIDLVINRHELGFNDKSDPATGSNELTKPNYRET